MIDEILALSKILISVPTVTGDEKALELAVEIAYQDLYEYHVKRFHHNGTTSLLYYNTPEFPERFKILLSTNLDVVSAEESQFKPYIHNGKLYGRGAYDTKTASAAMILLFKELAKKINYPLGLQIVADGEFDSKSIKTQLEQHDVRADFIISSIPTDLAVSHMSKGMLWMKIKTTGRAGHSAFPWTGENAIRKMKNFLNQLEREFPEPKQEVWQTTVNIANISTTNKEFNNIPDNCEVLLDIRYIPEDEKTIIGKITKLLPEGFTEEIVINDHSEATIIDHKEFQLLTKAIEKVTKDKAQIIKKHYADAVRYFKPYGGFGASIGPKGANAHAENEWVDIASVKQYYKILREFLLSVS